MRRHSARPGFTLIETLCAALVIGILACAAMPVFRGRDEMLVVREEAENLRAWLSSRMAQTARDGAEFRLTIDENRTTQELGFTLQWYGGPRDLDKETYTASRAMIMRDSLARTHSFDGKWFTLTPAASFIIRSRKDSGAAVVLTVSGTGYVGIRETLKE